MAYLKPNLSRLMDYHSNSQAGFNESTMKKKRKTFSVEEDQKLMQLVEEHGNKNWEIISSKIKTRSARQCRERWKFYLCPNVNRSPWTPEEDHILYEKYNILGPKWSLLCKCFHNRSLNNVKNRWNSITRKIRTLNLNLNSEEDFFYCGRLITKNSPSLPKKINDKDPILTDEHKENDAQFDPLCFFQINNLLNQLPETA